MSVAAMTRYAPAVSRSRNSMASRCAQVLIGDGAHRAARRGRSRWCGTGAAEGRAAPRSRRPAGAARLRSRSWRQPHGGAAPRPWSAGRRPGPGASPRSGRPSRRRGFSAKAWRRSRIVSSGGSMCSSRTSLQSRQPDARRSGSCWRTTRLVGVGREDLVQVEHRADVRIAGIASAACARGRSPSAGSSAG